MSDTSSILIARQFGSFEELTELAVAWDTDFRQIGAEQAKSELFQARLGHMLLSNARFGCQVQQGGSTPVGMRTFAILRRHSPPVYWYGHFVDQDTLMVFPDHREIHVISRPGFQVQTFSIPEAVLAEGLVRLEFSAPSRTLKKTEQVVRAPAEVLDGFRSLLHQAAQRAGAAGSPGVWADSGRNLQDEILFRVLELLGGQATRSLSRQTPKERSLGAALDYIDTHLQQPISFSKLCDVTRASERTVRNLFRQKIGMSPMAYVKGRRLHGVYRALYQERPWQTHVSDVANQWGFWHMGQFAADYRKLFGELPSETLAKPYKNR